MSKEQNKNENPSIKWLRRLGFAGFMFFFIKGLVWLAIIFGAGYFGYEAVK